MARSLPALLVKARRCPGATLGQDGEGALCERKAPTPHVSETQVKRADAPKVLEFSWGDRTSGRPIGSIVGAEAMKFGGWQRLNAEYAKQLRPPVGPLAHGPEHAPLQRNGHRLLDRHRALLPADELHRVRATALSTSFGGLHPP